MRFLSSIDATYDPTDDVLTIDYHYTAQPDGRLHMEPEEDELGWGYGPLAQSHAAPAALSADDDGAATAAAGAREFDKIARAAAVRADNAAGGRAKRNPRRKKDKKAKAGFKASDLLKAAPSELVASPGRALSPATGGALSPTTGDVSSRGAAAGRAARQPFGAVATTHRRRAGGRATADDAPKDGGGATLAEPREPPADGYDALTEPQVAVVREVFDHVDVGSKGWLCRDDVQHIVHTLNTPAAAAKPSRRGAGGGAALSKSEALERTRLLPDEQEQRKQDSFRGATSPTPEDDEDDEAQLWGQTRSAGRLTAQDMDRQVAEAEKERRRGALRQKKRAEREAAATVELLKVLVRVTPEERALRQLHGAAAEPPIRLSFGDFSAAVDHAMLTTSTGGGGKGARPGELYCRKMVTHWRWARGSAPVQGQFFTDQPLGMAAGGSGGGYSSEMLELLVPLSMRDDDTEEEEIL